MRMMRTAEPSFNRRALDNRAMQAAIATWAKDKLDRHSPICICGLCGTLGVTVRFNFRSSLRLTLSRRRTSALATAASTCRAL